MLFFQKSTRASNVPGIGYVKFVRQEKLCAQIFLTGIRLLPFSFVASEGWLLDDLKNQMTIFIILKEPPPHNYSGITVESSSCAHQDGSYEM